MKKVKEFKEYLSINGDEPMGKRVKPVRYRNLDGLRAYACIGIILMHVLTNGHFVVTGFVFERLIPSFTNFTYLFMVLSAFSMCCGYYEEFSSGNVDLEQFYIRRYRRIWPYFALLCTIELIVDHSLNSLYEWFADITLAFGLIPNHKIGVVGVGWFLGVVFVFYMVFPFFIFFLKNKRRAWLLMTTTLFLNILCHLRFTEAVGRSTFIYSAMFFAAGGLIYLYREKLNREKVGVAAFLCFAVVTVFYYIVSGSDYTLLVLFSLLAIFGISFKGRASVILFQNKLIQFIASISMEVYLCHMFVYRAIERARLFNLMDKQILNYLFAVMGTIIGAILMAVVIKKLIALAEERIQKSA